MREIREQSQAVDRRRPAVREAPELARPRAPGGVGVENGRRRQASPARGYVQTEARAAANFGLAAVGHKERKAAQKASQALEQADYERRRAAKAREAEAKRGAEDAEAQCRPRSPQQRGRQAIQAAGDRLRYSAQPQHQQISARQYAIRMRGPRNDERVSLAYEARPRQGARAQLAAQGGDFGPPSWGRHVQ